MGISRAVSGFSLSPSRFLWLKFSIPRLNVIPPRMQAPQPLHEYEHFQSHATPTVPDNHDFEWYQKWRLVQIAVSNFHYPHRTANVVFSSLLGFPFVWYFLFLSVSSISTNMRDGFPWTFHDRSEMTYIWIKDVCFFILFGGEGVYYLHTGKTCEIFMTFSR